MHTQTLQSKRSRRHARIRAKVKGTAERPRLAVYKSNTSISAQLIDDDAQTSLGGVVSSKVASQKKGIEQAELVGVAIAELAKKHSISRIVFDRGGFIYAGRIKALAEAARKGGLMF